jgi:hypothetical protein
VKHHRGLDAHEGHEDGVDARFIVQRVHCLRLDEPVTHCPGPVRLLRCGRAAAGWASAAARPTCVVDSATPHPT